MDGWMSRGFAGMVGGATAMIAIAGLGIAGCASQDNGDGVSVVATTTVLGDIVGDIVECAGGTTTTLMPLGADPHDYSPSSADMTTMVKADLVVANGLGLEEGLEDAINNAVGDGATVFEVAPELDPITFDAHGADTEESAEEAEAEGSSLDPHVWHDVARMATAATLIAEKLGSITEDTETFQRCGAEVSAALTTVDAQVRATLATIASERRVLITDHAAFGYLASAYDFEIAGVVIPGGSTLASPSSAEIAALVQVIKDTGVPAIFSSTSLSTDLIDTVAREVGTEIKVVPLFVESLGEQGSGAETYAAMVQTNATRIAGALNSGN